MTAALYYIYGTVVIFLTGSYIVQYSLSCLGVGQLAIGPLTLQLKLQKEQLSSTRSTNFFHNCNALVNSSIFGQQFSQRFFFTKIFAVLVVVCKGVKALSHYKDFHKDFCEKIVEKLVAVVKKSCGVNGQ